MEGAARGDATRLRDLICRVEHVHRRYIDSIGTMGLAARLENADRIRERLETTERMLQSSALDPFYCNLVQSEMYGMAEELCDQGCIPDVPLSSEYFQVLRGFYGPLRDVLLEIVIAEGVADSNAGRERADLNLGRI